MASLTPVGADLDVEGQDSGREPDGLAAGGGQHEGVVLGAPRRDGPDGGPVDLRRASTPRSHAQQRVSALDRAGPPAGHRVPGGQQDPQRGRRPVRRGRRRAWWCPCSACRGGRDGVDAVVLLLPRSQFATAHRRIGTRVGLAGSRVGRQLRVPSMLTSTWSRSPVAHRRGGRSSRGPQQPLVVGNCGGRPRRRCGPSMIA